MTLYHECTICRRGLTATITPAQTGGTVRFAITVEPCAGCVENAENKGRLAGRKEMREELKRKGKCE